MVNKNNVQEVLENYPDVAQMIERNIIFEHKLKVCESSSLKSSEVGHDCERYLAYRLLNATEARAVDEDTILIFNEGSSQEKQILLELQKAGIEVSDVRFPIKIKELNVVGQIDCIARLECEIEPQKTFWTKIPCEIKSMSEFVFNSINTVEDLDKYPWTRKYYAQVQIYMKNDCVEFPCAYLIAKNRNTGKIKLIKDYDGGNVIKFNPRYYKKLYDKLKRINKQVEKIKTSNFDETKYPPRCRYDTKICKNCAFSDICIKDIISSADPIITDKSVLKNIYRLAKLKRRKNIYSQIDKEYKEASENLKAVMPLANANYQAGKFRLETKIVNAKNPYLSFEIISST